jgi:hypothetical protein
MRWHAHTPNWMFCESKHWLLSAILGAPESAVGSDLAARRTANLTAFGGGHGARFVAVTGQLLDLPSAGLAELPGSGQRDYLVWLRSMVKART